jgi:uncharacterized protein DUF6644
MAVPTVIQWLNETALSVYLRESELAFPLTEAIHLLALAVSVGTVMWVDFRLMGLSLRNERVSDVVGRLEPWAVGGFVVMFVSGILLFLGKPENYYTTTPFRIKMVLLPLAGLNVLFFHKTVYRNVARWDKDTVVPWQGRLAGSISVLLWAVIIVLGRWTAYFADELFRRSR